MSAVGNFRTPLGRLPGAFMLQFLVPSSLIWVPALVFFSSWVIAAGIGWFIQVYAGGVGEPLFTGAAQATLWCLVFMAAYAASHSFPFAMALSYSRRIFTLGAVLAFALVALVFGMLFAVAAFVELRTEGLGISTFTFALPFLVDGRWGVLGGGLVVAAATHVLMIGAFAVVLVYRRVGLTRLWLGILAIAAVLGVSAAVLTAQEAWPAVLRWLGALTVSGATAYLALASAGLSALTYGIIRRTPSS